MRRPLTRSTATPMLAIAAIAAGTTAAQAPPSPGLAAGTLDAGATPAPTGTSPATTPTTPAPLPMRFAVRLAKDGKDETASRVARLVVALPAGASLSPICGDRDGRRDRSKPGGICPVTGAVLPLDRTDLPDGSTKYALAISKRRPAVFHRGSVLTFTGIMPRSETYVPTTTWQLTFERAGRFTLARTFPRP